jgi:hypothetical protein
VPAYGTKGIKNGKNHVFVPPDKNKIEIFK